MKSCQSHCVIHVTGTSTRGEQQWSKAINSSTDTAKFVTVHGTSLLTLPVLKLPPFTNSAQSLCSMSTFAPKQNQIPTQYSTKKWNWSGTEAQLRKTNKKKTKIGVRRTGRPAGEQRDGASPLCPNPLAPPGAGHRVLPARCLQKHNAPRWGARAKRRLPSTLSCARSPRGTRQDGSRVRHPVLRPVGALLSAQNPAEVLGEENQPPPTHTPRLR